MQPRFFFTVDVEDWFTSTRILPNFDQQSYENSSDALETTRFIAALLKRYNIRGTFFFITSIARKHPELVRELIDAGHEIALHGETHDHLSKVPIEVFKNALASSQEFFASTFNLQLHGYRAPYFSIHPAAIAALKDAGFSYDSSVVPSLKIPGWYGVHDAPRLPYKIGKTLSQVEINGNFTEFPMSTHPTLRLGGLGGYYFRNLGLTYTTHVLQSCLKKLGYAIFYLHPWELSDSIPKLSGMPFYMRRNTGDWARNGLEKMIQSMKRTFPDISCQPLITEIPNTTH